MPSRVVTKRASRSTFRMSSAMPSGCNMSLPASSIASFLLLPLTRWNMKPVSINGENVLVTMPRSNIATISVTPPASISHGTPVATPIKSAYPTDPITHKTEEPITHGATVSTNPICSLPAGTWGFGSFLAALAFLRLAFFAGTISCAAAFAASSWAMMSLGSSFPASDVLTRGFFKAAAGGAFSISLAACLASSKALSKCST